MPRETLRARVARLEAEKRAMQAHLTPRHKRMPVDGYYPLRRLCWDGESKLTGDGIAFLFTAWGDDPSREPSSWADVPLSLHHTARLLCLATTPDTTAQFHQLLRDLHAVRLMPQSCALTVDIVGMHEPLPVAGIPTLGAFRQLTETECELTIELR